MKRFSILVMLVIIGTGAFAQTNTQNSLVGKWKIASVTANGMFIDMENPAALKKMISEEMKKQSGQAPDSATLSMIMTSMTSAMEKTRIEFLSNGKTVSSSPDNAGSLKRDTSNYSADYNKGIVTKQGKSGSKEEMTIKFEGEYLIIQKSGEAEIVRLRRAKD